MYSKCATWGSEKWSDQCYNGRESARVTVNGQSVHLLQLLLQCSGQSVVSVEYWVQGADASQTDRAPIISRRRRGRTLGARI